MTPRSPRWLLAGLVAALSVLAACGIPDDSKPREISREALPPELIDPASTDTSVPSDAASRFVTLYLVQGDDTAGDALVAVRREVAVPADTADLPRVVAEALIAAGPDSWDGPTWSTPSPPTCRSARRWSVRTACSTSTSPTSATSRAHSSASPWPSWCSPSPTSPSPR